MIFAFSFDSCQKKSQSLPLENVSDSKKTENIEENSADLEEISKSEKIEESEDSKKERAVRDFIANLPDEEKIAQLFLVNVEGNDEYRAVETRSDGKPLVPGGALLFSFNVAESADKVAAYTESIRAFSRERGLVAPFVAIDQEGGDVNRLRGLTSVLWSEQKVAERFSLSGAKDLYALQAKQLRLLGIDMNLAPVVEVSKSENREFLGSRSFGSISDVISYAGAEISAFEENGVASCLKHFPGNSATDPHVGLPKIDVKAEDFVQFIEPFSALSKNASAVLMSHAIAKIEGLEEKTKMPACFSSYWIQKLRENCGFSGLVVSDDVFMGALSKNGYPPENASLEAIRAGVDVIMLSEKRFGKEVQRLLDESKKDSDFARRLENASFF